MYESYWQLRQKPFEPGADPRFYYPGESHQAALLKLRYAIENRRGGVLLAGPSGVGKTLLSNMLREMLGENFKPFVQIVFPQMSTQELLAYLADELECTTGDFNTPSVQSSIQRIQQFLAANIEKQRHAVVVIDESHLISDPATFEALRLLMNFEIDGKPLMTLLLSGQAMILPMLNRMPSLEERLAVKCLLRPFGVEETAAYVSHRLKVAGATRTIIEPDAFSTLQELTHGFARQINRLCDLGLLIGYAEERKTLTAEHFESICDELVTVAPE
jgi:type II secretory pathway predicted ATPase ExeA